MRACVCESEFVRVRVHIYTHTHAHTHAHTHTYTRTNLHVHACKETPASTTTQKQILHLPHDSLSREFAQFGTRRRLLATFLKSQLAATFTM